MIHSKMVSKRFLRLDVALSPCALLQKLQLSRSAWGFGDLTAEGLATYQELERLGCRNAAETGVKSEFSWDIIWR